MNAFSSCLVQDEVIRTREESPYPHIVEQYPPCLPQCGSDGYFLCDGLLYGTVSRWAMRTGTGKRTLRRHLGAMAAESIRGIDLSGKERDFYSEADVDAVLEIFQKPKADRRGFFVHKGKRYATVKTLQRTVFCGISEDLITRRIAANGLSCIEGLTYFNRPQRFFAEEDVRRILCEDLAEVVALDNTGFKTVDGVLYGTELAWRRTLKLGSTTWHKRAVKRADMVMKNHKGRRCAVYAEHDVRSACTDELEYRRRADEQGFFCLKGERYGTRYAWARALGLSTNAISRRVDITLGIDGVSASGVKQRFFCEAHVRAVCASLLDKPRADEDGYLVESGEPYGLQSGICRDYNVTWSKVAARIAGKPVRTIVGKNRITRDSTFYCMADIARYCAEVIAIPRANEAGVFCIDKETFATRKRWNVLMALPNHRVERLLASSTFTPVKGVDSRGNVQAFYGELDIRRAVAEFNGDDPYTALIRYLPTYRVRRNTRLLQGVAGDTIHVFPRRLHGCIETAVAAFDVHADSQKRIGIVKGRPILLYESELL